MVPRSRKVQLSSKFILVMGSWLCWTVSFAAAILTLAILYYATLCHVALYVAVNFVRFGIVVKHTNK